jgi:hypothetical protein
MTGIEEAAKAITTTDEDNRNSPSKTNGTSKYASSLRSSSSNSTKSGGGGSRQNIGRSKSLTPQNTERDMVRSQSEVWTHSKKNNKKKANGVLIKPTISPEDEALFQSRRRQRKTLHGKGVKFDFVQLREHAITM